MKKLLLISSFVFASILGWAQKDPTEPVMSDAEMKRLQNLPDSTRLKLEAKDLSHRNPYAAFTSGGDDRRKKNGKIIATKKKAASKPKTNPAVLPKKTTSKQPPAKAK